MTIWNIAIIVIVVTMIAIAGLRWKALPREPERFPGRYDLNGRPETWTGRRVVWLYPVIALSLSVVLRVTIGERMAPLSLFISAMLLYQMLRTLGIANRRADQLPRWFMPVMIFGVFLVVLVSSIVG